MDRLTCKYEDANVLREQCTFDRLSTDEPDDWVPCCEICEMKYDDTEVCEACPIQIAIDRLAEYENTGLSPDRIKEIERMYMVKAGMMTVMVEEIKSHAIEFEYFGISSNYVELSYITSIIEKYMGENNNRSVRGEIWSPIELKELLHNLRDRDWDVNPIYKIDENEGKKLIKALEEMCDIAQNK